MKEEAIQISKSGSSLTEKLHLLREYLQALILRSLHESEAFTCLSFVGGTALRFLYDLPRFSEDLDFSLENADGYQLDAWMKKVERDMRYAAFDVSVKQKTVRTVQGIWVGVSGLLKEAGISPLASQKISVKLEVDTHPPQGARSETHIVNKYFFMAVRHYDLPSLMAGKIHALYTRKYLKGRDFYDLLWYRTQRPPIEPNLELLQAALHQTQDKPWPAEEWKARLSTKLEEVDWEKLVEDVGPFLEHPDDVKLLKPAFFQQIL